MPRRRHPARQTSAMLRWAAWGAGLLGLAGAVLVLLAPTLAAQMIRAYLVHEDFQPKAEALLSKLTGGTAQIDSLSWHDEQATISELRVQDAHGWDAEASGVHASLDFGAIRDGVWRLENVGADELRLQPSTSPGLDKDEALETLGAAAVPALLRRYIPNRTEVAGCEVQRLFLEHSGWRIAEARLQAGAWNSGRTSLPFTLSGGSLMIPLILPEQKEHLNLSLEKGTLRLSEGQLQLSNARLRWKEAAEATLRGSVKFDNAAWQAQAHVEAVPVGEFLNARWKTRLHGLLKGDLDFYGREGQSSTWKAELALQDGVLEGLPLLDTLATYTRVERFKRLVLDVCQGTVRPLGNQVEISQIILQSNGLLRVEGALTLTPGQPGLISGDFWVGVTPDTLRWIPGAQSRVFVETNPGGAEGMVWTRVKVAGTLEAPQEDLSSRLVGGAGMALLLDTPGEVINQAADALLKPVLGEEAAKVPGKVMESAGAVLENGVKTGVDLLNKTLPLPGLVPGGK